MEGQELQVQDKEQAIQKYTLTNPNDIVSFSKILEKFITDSKLSTTIQRDKYVNVDGWKFAGLNFGIVPIVGEPIPIHEKGQMVTILYHEIEVRDGQGRKRITVPYFASVNSDLVDKFKKDTTVRELVTDYFSYKVPCELYDVRGRKVGAGFGMCSNLELKKVTFDEFAVMSMAQTRAIGRAYKNVLGFIMKAAGYSPTPLEEMENESRAVMVDANTMLDIDAGLEGCATIDELTRLWNDLDSNTQASRKVKNAFNRRKIEIKKDGNT